MSGFDHVYDWLKAIPKKSAIPPFVVELVLRDGRSFYLNSIGNFDEQSDSIAIRVWDFRAFTENDIDVLKTRIAEIAKKSNLREMRAEKICPKLDWGILRVHVKEIAYCIEWHDRSWPEDARPQKIGFDEH